MNSGNNGIGRARIGLLDHLGGGNLGDDATLEAVKQNIRSRLPEAEILGFTMNPDDTRLRHGITAYPIRRRTWALGTPPASPDATFKAGVKSFLNRWRLVSLVVKSLRAVIRPLVMLADELLFLARSFKRVRLLDLLIVNGGGQLLDWFGPWQYPYTIYKWVLLARFGGVKCIFLNVGAGPLERPLSRFFIRRALFYSQYVSFRDERSRALALSIGYKRPAHVFPDCVYALERPSVERTSSGRSSRPVVGIAPMPFSDPRSVYPEKNQREYDRFIGALGKLGSWLLGAGLAVTLLCTDIGVDPPAVEDVRTALECQDVDVDIDGKLVSVPPVGTIEEVLRVIGSLDYFVTCRFHGVVFAHMLNVPVLALSHHPKMNTLMAELGLEEYCLDIRTADGEVLRKAFTSLVNNRDRIKASMAERSSLYRKRLSRQFDELIPAGLRPPPGRS